MSRPCMKSYLSAGISFGEASQDEVEGFRARAGVVDLGLVEHPGGDKCAPPFPRQPEIFDLQLAARPAVRPMPRRV